MTVVRQIIDPATGLALFVTPSDPTTGSGLAAQTGSLANVAGSGTWYAKTGAAATAWSQLAATSGFLPLSGGALNAGANLTVPGTLTAGAGSFGPITVTGALTHTGGQFATAQQAVSGSAVSGFGGGWVSKDDGGTVRWAAGVLGSAGARAYQIYDIVNSRAPFAIDATTGVVSIGLGLNVSGGITGTLLTSSQPNVTTVGTLVGLTSSSTITSTGGVSWTSVGWAKSLSLASAAAIAFGTGLGVGVKRFLVGNGSGVLYFATVADDGTGTAPTYLLTLDGPTGLASFTNGLTVTGALNATLTTASQPNVTSLGTLSSLVVTGNIWAGALNNGITLAVQSAFGSLMAGYSLVTVGSSSGSVNLFARGDTGTVGQGVIVSYWDGGAWRAAVDVRNASGFSTLNLMPAGGSVVVGATLSAVTYQVGGVKVIDNGGGANLYHQFSDPSGSTGIHLGGTVDPGNYYSNTTHYFRSRGGSVTWMTLNTSGLSLATSVTSPIFATAGLLRLAGQELYAVNVPSDTAYTGAIQVREAGHAASAANSSSLYAPKVAFHWGGIVASQIAMESGGAMAWRAGGAGQAGRIAIINNPGTNYEDLMAAQVWANTNVRVNIGDRGYGIVGVYDSTKYRLVYGMDIVYTMASDGSTLRPGPDGLYGLFYCYDQVTGGKNASGHNLNHGLGLAAAGVSCSFIGQSGIWTVGSVFANSYMYAADFILTSDARVKRDVVRITDAMERLRELRGYTFLRDGDTRRTAGLLAQDVRRVLPEAVYEEGGLLKLGYTQLHALHVEAALSLDARVSRLEAKVA